MINRISNINESDRLLASLLDLYRDRILKSHKKLEAEECVYGKSEEHSNILFFQFNILLGMLIKNRSNQNYSFDQISSIFNFEELRKKLVCKSINFDKFIDLINIKESEEDKGISIEIISETFRVGLEAENSVLGKQDISNYIQDLKFCNLTDDLIFGLGISERVGLETLENTLIEL